MSNPPNDPNLLARAEAASAALSDDPQRTVREKYQAILETVWREPDDCPICKSSAWNLGDLVDVHLRHTPQTHDLLGAALGNLVPQVYVYVPVTCVYCGYTLLFHSGVLDVRGSEEIKTKPPLRFTKGQQA